MIYSKKHWLWYIVESFKSNTITRQKEGYDNIAFNMYKGGGVQVEPWSFL